MRSVSEVKERLIGVSSLVREVMIEGVDYGASAEFGGRAVKPSLLLPGAEKLGVMFEVQPSYEIRSERDGVYVSHLVKCTLLEEGSGHFKGEGWGSCSTKESKYSVRTVKINTGEPVPMAYWDAKKAGDTKTCASISRGMGVVKGEDGNWYFTKMEKGENEFIADQENTALKMAMKRAYISAIIKLSACASLFTHDMEVNETVEVSKPKEEKPKTLGAAKPAGESTLIPSKVKLPEDYWKVKSKDAATALNMIGGKGYAPVKAVGEDGVMTWFIGAGNPKFVEALNAKGVAPNQVPVEMSQGQLVETVYQLYHCRTNTGVRPANKTKLEDLPYEQLFATKEFLEKQPVIRKLSDPLPVPNAAVEEVHPI